MLWSFSDFYRVNSVLLTPVLASAEASSLLFHDERQAFTSNLTTTSTGELADQLPAGCHGYNHYPLPTSSMPISAHSRHPAGVGKHSAGRVRPFVWAWAWFWFWFRTGASGPGRLIDGQIACPVLQSEGPLVFVCSRSGVSLIVFGAGLLTVKKKKLFHQLVS